MFDMELDWDRPARSGPNPTPHILRVRLIPGAQAATASGLPLRVAVALDASSSMEGEKMARAKDACRAILGLLRSVDRLSLAGFASGIEPLLFAVEGGPDVLERAELGLARLQAYGATRAELALDWIQTALPAEPGVTRLGILITDGLPTDLRGNALTDTNELIERGALLGESGITLCTVGLGDAAHFNTAFLTDLSDRGHGAFLYASTPSELEPQLRDRLAAAQTVANDEARLILRPLVPGLLVPSACRFRPEFVPLSVAMQGEEFALPLGALRADMPTDVLISLRVLPPDQNSENGTRPILQSRLHIGAASEPCAEATASLTETDSYAQSQTLNADVNADRLHWDIAQFSSALHRTADPRRTAELLSNIRFTAEKAGQPHLAMQAMQQLDDLKKTGKMNAHRATGLLTASRRTGELP